MQPLRRHIGLYAYQNQFCKPIRLYLFPPLEQIEALEQLRVLWNGIAIAVHVTEPLSARVDTPEDLERVRQFLKFVQKMGKMRFKRKPGKFRKIKNH